MLNFIFRYAHWLYRHNRLSHLEHRILYCLSPYFNIKLSPKNRGILHEQLKLVRKALIDEQPPSL